jgi:hypothetical protein
MTSCTSLVKMRQVRLYMTRPRVAKEVKEINKTKKKKKRLGCPSSLVTPTYDPTTATTAHFSNVLLPLLQPPDEPPPFGSQG